MPDALHVEETRSSETVFEGSLIRVRRDVVSLHGGKTTAREIVEHAPVVAMVALDAEGLLVLVRQFRKPVERVLIEIPAGGIEPDEQPEDAVRREMREETGYEPAHIESLLTVYPSPGFTTEVMHIFLVSDLRGDGRPTEEQDEIELLRVSKEDAYRMVRDGEITDAKSVAGILMLQSKSREST